MDIIAAFYCNFLQRSCSTNALPTNRLIKDIVWLHTDTTIDNISYPYTQIQPRFSDFINYLELHINHHDSNKNKTKKKVPRLNGTLNRNLTWRLNFFNHLIVNFFFFWKKWMECSKTICSIRMNSLRTQFKLDNVQ